MRPLKNIALYSKKDDGKRLRIIYVKEKHYLNEITVSMMIIVKKLN